MAHTKNLGNLSRDDVYKAPGKKAKLDLRLSPLLGFPSEYKGLKRDMMLWRTVIIQTMRDALSGDKGAFGLGFNVSEYSSMLASDKNYFYTQKINIAKAILKIFKLKPVHTRVDFPYGDIEFGRAFGRGFNGIPAYDGTCPNGDFNSGFGNAGTG